MRTLTFHPDRSHPLQERVETFTYRFDDPAALTRSLRGRRHALQHLLGPLRSWPDELRQRDRELAHAVLCRQARRGQACRARQHHQPLIESPLPYFRGKALVEYALAQSGLRYSIVRPTWIYGGERDVLANNIAWILRRMPAFALPGDGAYPVQPVHVEDLARICIEAAGTAEDVVLDAAGPETMPFGELVALVREAVNARSPIIHMPPSLMATAARALGLFVRDVVLTPDEIKGLTAGLLVSHDAPLGHIAFSQWLKENRTSVGRSYANELDRHFAIEAAA